MNRRPLSAAALAGLIAMGAARVLAAECEGEGAVRFICGVSAPEDLVAVPGGDWVLASGISGAGLHLVNTRSLAVTRLFPVEKPRVRLDSASYARCPGPLKLAPGDKVSAHGLNLRPGANRVHTVYMVHHGARESIEVFELDARPRMPVLTWIGCVVAPESVGLNAVAPLRQGGFVATSPVRRGDPTARQRMQKGESSGEVWEWSPGSGWSMIPGSEAPGPNGIEASTDGQWLYVNLYAVRQVMRLSRGRIPFERQVVDVPFHPDNLRWQADGSLLAAGHAAPTLARTSECLGKPCPDATSNVARIDPKTLAAREIVRHPSSEAFFAATAALQVGKEVWLGAVRGDRIARYPLK